MADNTVTLDTTEPLKGSPRVKTSRKARASVSEAKRTKGKGQVTLGDLKPPGFSDMPEKGAADIRKRAEAILNEVIRPIFANAALPGDCAVMYGRLSGNIGDVAGDSTTGSGTLRTRDRVPGVQVLYPNDSKYDTGGKILVLLPYSWGSPAQVIARTIAGLCEVVCIDPASGKANPDLVGKLMGEIGFMGHIDPKGNGAQRKRPTAASWDQSPKLARVVANHLRKHGPIPMTAINVKEKRDRSERGSSMFRWRCQHAACKGGFSMTKDEDAAYRGAVKKGENFMRFAPCGHDPRNFLLYKAPNVKAGEMPEQPKFSKVKLGAPKGEDGKTAPAKKVKAPETEAPTPQVEAIHA